MTKVYNINEMYPALVKARENGNRSAINKKMCDELGILEGFFRQYLTNMECLFKAVHEYVRVKNSPTASEADRKAAMNPIFPIWKSILECGEDKKTVKLLHCNEHDISNLVSHVQKFVNDANNVDFEKKFVAQKVWASNTLTQFRKRVETDIGIRIANVTVLTDEERDRLASERRILNKIGKVQKKIDAEKVQAEALTKLITQTKDENEKKSYENQISDKAGIIADCEKTIAELKEELKGKPEAEKAA